MGAHLNEKMEASAKYVIEVLTVELRETEAEIKNPVHEDEELAANYELIKSVAG